MPTTELKKLVVYLPPAVHRELKIRAARADESMSETVRRLVTKELKGSLR